MRFFLLAVVFSSALFANPEACSLESGTIEHFVRDSNLLEVKLSDRAVLNWDSFSIAEGETTRFIQPSADSAVLNRVIGNFQSEIFGTLTSNGLVYLTNPKGIVIGKEGRIDTAAFIASTLALSTQEFLRGESLSFQGDSKEAITNLGTIETSTGPITLIAHKVENRGLLRAHNSEVNLNSCHEVFFDPTGDDLIYIALEMPGEGIEQEGIIEAFQTRLIAVCDPTAIAINVSGTIEANAIERIGGEIHLVAKQGKTKLTGSLLATHDQGIGGTVHVLGNEVELANEALIDVSGKKGGGTLLIGGDLRGENPNIQNAKTVFVGKDVLLKANALEEGDGGKIIVWGNKSNLFYGNAEIRGGSFAGNGGFIETSGAYLDFQGKVDPFAPNGNLGNILMDPSDITISAAADSGGAFSACPGSSYTPSAATSVINTTTLKNLLESGGGCNVTINTSSGAGGTGSIQITGSLTWITASTLTLVSDSFISISSSVTNTSASTGFTGMHFTASGTVTGSYHGITINTTVSTVGGDIYMNGTGKGASQRKGILVTGPLTTTNGNMTLIGQGSLNSSSTENVGVSVEGASVSATGSGTITINGTGGGPDDSYCFGVYITDTDGLISVANGNLYITAQGGDIILHQNNCGMKVEFEGILRTTGSGNIIVTATAGQSIDTANGFELSGVGSILSSSTGNITINGTGSTGTSSNGIAFTFGPGAIIQSTGSGILTFNGFTATSSTSSNYGILIDNEIGSASNTGNLVFSGTSQGTGTGKHGVAIVNHAPAIRTSSGNISITGQAGSGTEAADGVNISTSGTVVSGSGSITIAGTALASGTSYGIDLQTANGITSTTGAISLTGTGGTGPGSDGINLAVAWSPATTAAVTLNGTRGSGAGSADIDFSTSLTAAGALSVSGTELILSQNLSGTSVSVSSTGTITLNAAVTVTSPGAITFSSTGTTALSNTSAIQITAGANQTLSMQAATIQLATGNTISGDGTILLIANDNFTCSGASGTIQNTAAGYNVTIVADQANNSPNIGAGVITIPTGYTLCANSCAGGSGQVLLFAGSPTALNVFPSTINGTAYASGTNEFLGYWYPSKPASSAPFMIMFKQVTPAAPVPSSEVVAVATTEAVTNQNQLPSLTQITAPTSAPQPSSSCKTPSVSVQAL